MKKIIFTLLILATVLPANADSKGFAIVIDPASYEHCKPLVDQYADEIEKEGLKTYLIIDQWYVPDSIRHALIDLYERPDAPIEGVVLLGDIPVAMVRDAQHMTSAFKMDQAVFDRKMSSVPSDRFYDDFNLDFEFLDRDVEQPAWFYYSLTANSAQQLNPSIYSGRVRPTDTEGSTRFEKLDTYLRKVIAAKRNPQPLNQMLYFSGNGFISESMLARIDEKATFYEHFPWLKRQQSGISYIDHRQDPYIKFRLMNELQRHDLDFAMLHHHGDWNTQYMNDLPSYKHAAEQVDAIKIYLRESMRHAKERGRNLDSIQTVLREKFTVPDQWFEGAFDPELTSKDSLHLDKLDLYISDFTAFEPNCRFVVLDACFNGSFHRENSIANSYIFSPGNTVAVLANSVNVLQDKWTDRNLGLLGLGWNAGNLVKYGSYLESHLIGDPTFHFAVPIADLDINGDLRQNDPVNWTRYTGREDYPALQAFGINRLFEYGLLDSDRLLEIFKSSKSHLVRTEVLTDLSRIRDDNFIECLNLAVTDDYEMVQRFAMKMIELSGDERLIPALIRTAIRNNTSERIEFSVKQALPMFRTELLSAEFERQFPQTHYMDSEQVKRQIGYAIEYNGNRWIKPMEEVVAEETSEKTRRQNIRSMRNYHVHFMVPELLEYLKTCPDEETKLMLLEAFGWFRLSYRADEIAATLKNISESSDASDPVRAEALKSYKRLSQ